MLPIAHGRTKKRRTTGQTTGQLAIRLPRRDKANVHLGPGVHCPVVMLCLRPDYLGPDFRKNLNIFLSFS